MCRIAGIIDFYNPASLDKLQVMRDCMEHGGPDDAGSYVDPDYPIAFGVRRLALLDLSQNGHQPMATPDESVWIAFNGELYNFKELREELKALGHFFRSGTDTEVVLLSWKQWGSDCFNRFNGMFGLCIWDKQKQQLILARDHAGMKPLYYYFDSNKRQLFFASEVRAFKTMDPAWPEDERWRVNLLGYGHMPEPHTTLQHVVSLPKASYMLVDIPSFKSTLEKWYKYPNTYHASEKEAADQLLNQTVDTAVQQHLVADAPIGVFLSGGIDSSIVTLLAARHIPQNLFTLSITFDEAEYSEKKYQDIIIAQTGCRHRSFNVTRAEFENCMPDILQAMDQPSNDGINSYFISKYAKASGLKAVLSGVGADELFGGYETFKRRQTAGRLRKLPGWMLGLAANISDDRLKRISFLRYPGRHAEYLFYRGFYTPAQIAGLLDMDETEVKKVLLGDRVEKKQRELSDGEYISQIELDFYLQNQLLRDTDCMSMWHSVEIRMPFLDRNVMELCAQTKPAIRFEQGVPKKWLIDSFKQALPREVWNRKKMGFTFPFNSWFKKVSVAGACDSRFFEIEKQFKKGNIRWSRYWAWLLCMGEPLQFSGPAKRVLFITLKTFSATGGIEKFNRAFSKALQQNARENNWQVSVFAIYDQQPEGRYFSPYGFKGFNGKKTLFTWSVFNSIPAYDIIIAGHINLAPLLVFSRFKRKDVSLQLIAHGIEVWQPLTYAQKKLLSACSAIWSVSRFTAKSLVNDQQVSAGKIKLFPNTLDPFFAGSDFSPSGELLKERYQIARGVKIILTVTRLASTEKYKGYDEVLRVLPAVLKQYPGVRYLLCGKADELEHNRLKHLIAELNLQDVVILTGFIPDEELMAHYRMADMFVMPSRKEGFGIVFIEAAWLGLHVIAGNQDGSVDALLDGELGTLVDPTSSAELEVAILQALKCPPSPAQKEVRRRLVEENFGFDKFKQRQRLLLEEAVTSKV